MRVVVGRNFSAGSRLLEKVIGQVLCKIACLKGVIYFVSRVRLYEWYELVFITLLFTGANNFIS